MAGTTVRRVLKDVSEILDWTFDWSPELSPINDTISTSTWTVPAGLTSVSQSSTGTSTTIKVSGGTTGTVYTLTNQIVTVGGRTEERGLVLVVWTGGSDATSDYYCSVDDLNALLKQLPLTETSKPSIPDAFILINDVAQLIDATIGTNYVTPVTSTNSGAISLQLLRQACTWGAVGRIQEIRNTGVVAEKDAVKSIWTKKLEEWLGQLMDNDHPLRLSDATVASDTVPKAPSQIADGFQLTFTADGDDYDLDNPSSLRDQVF